MARDISNSDNVIDSRDVIKRIAELESDLETQHNDEITAGLDEDADPPEDAPDFEAWLASQAEGDNDDARELIALRALQDQAEGYTDWRHGATLIRDSYFETYAQEVAEDIGAINREASWPNSCIDWEQAAIELQQDYTSVEFDGETYWVR